MHETIIYKYKHYKHLENNTIIYLLIFLFELNLFISRKISWNLESAFLLVNALHLTM